ncbi:hypothetical protein C0W44_10760 [Photobacterium leiognathi subsp. mandapamensis]|nr:hypothetical protein C0W44_10760 [Photobacterium leiognathi subsp. mandapamensis]
MKLKKWALACAMISPSVDALEVCNIGDEYNVVTRENFHEIRKSNYRNFSENLTSDDLFLSAPDHTVDIRPSLTEADSVFPTTASLLEVGPTNAALLETEEAASLLTTLGRSTAGLTKGVLEALGPIGDTVAVGLWAHEVAQSFEDETKTSYDRFTSVMSLIDWFGVLKLPAREIDRQILTARWNRVAASDHYSFTVHNDIVTQQDKKDKQHWADLASGQQRMLEATAQNYASDIALKYQQHYQEAVQAQSQLAETLIAAVDSEVQKTIFNKLALEGENAKLFASDLSSICRDEINTLLALYPEQEPSNVRPIFVPSKKAANRALAQLQQCQQTHLDLAITKLDELKNGEINGLNRQTLHQLYRQVLNAKIKIVDTANVQIDQLRAQLKNEMRSAGLSAIDRLFESGAVTNAHRYFKDQAEYLAIDEMSRSIFGRPATNDERRRKYFVVQKGYEKCTRIGMLGGDPHFMGCTEYTWIPAEIEHYDASKDEVIAQMTMPNKKQIKQVFLQSLETLIKEGWNAQHEEAWLEQQIINFSNKQRITSTAASDKARVMHWLFGSSAALAAECGTGSACAAWSSEYLAKENLSRNASLHLIASWFEKNKNSGYNVHSKRLAKLGSLIPQALNSEWQANHVNGFYSYLYPGSFDLDKYAPLIASALKASNLDIHNLAASLPQAKSIVKKRIAEAMNVTDSNGDEWLASQIGDFQRYVAIIHAQNISTGHYASGDTNVTALFSEPLPAHLLRYLTLNVYQNIDDIDSAYYYPAGHDREISYDVRLHASIDNVFNTGSELNEKIKKLVQVNESFSRLAGRQCMIHYPQLKEALLAISGDDSLYWLTPFSDWFDSVTKQQLALFSTIRFAVIKQNERNIPCDLSPNNPIY